MGASDCGGGGVFGTWSLRDTRQATVDSLDARTSGSRHGDGDYSHVSCRICGSRYRGLGARLANKYRAFVGCVLGFLHGTFAPDDGGPDLGLCRTMGKLGRAAGTSYRKRCTTSLVAVARSWERQKERSRQSIEPARQTRPHSRTRPCFSPLRGCVRYILALPASLDCLQGSRCVRCRDD